MKHHGFTWPVVTVPIVIWIVFSLGCTTANPRHSQAVASQTVAQALFAIQDAEEAAYRAAKLTPAQHMTFNQSMLAALLVGKEFNTAVLAWQPGTPPPAQLPRLKELLSQLAGPLIAGFPPDVQLEIQRTVTAAYDAVLAVILAAQGGA